MEARQRRRKASVERRERKKITGKGTEYKISLPVIYMFEHILKSVLSDENIM